MTAQVVPFNPFFLHTSPTGPTTTHSQEVLVVPVLPTTNHMELHASVALHLQLTRPPPPHTVIPEESAQTSPSPQHLPNFR